MPAVHGYCSLHIGTDAYAVPVGGTQRHLIIYILVKTGPKHDRTDRKNISVESAHWLSAERAMTDARLLANRFNTRNMIG